jgi:ABC-type multidrug transport system permease subunit
MLWALIKAKRAKLSSMFATFGVQVLCMVLSGGILFGLIMSMYKLYESRGAFSDYLVAEQYGGKADGFLYILLFAFMAAFAFSLLFLWKKQDKKHPEGKDFSNLLGVLLLPALLGEICVWLMPGAVYLFCFPVLAALIAITAKLLLPGAAPILTASAIFVSLLLYVPLVYLLCAALLIPNAFVIVPIAILTLSIVLGKADFGLRLAD